MTSFADILCSDHPYTADLLAKESIGGLALRKHHASPVSSAFGTVADELRYDLAELAIGAFLQAREYGKPLLLLPLVIEGGSQHHNLFASPARQLSSAADLKGGRVGVRSYSQTTGLWVRAWLAEEFGVRHDSVTWVTKEPSHIGGYHDPGYVVHTDRPLIDELLDGSIDALLVGPRSAPASAVPLVPDYAERDRRWYREHGFVPVNHLLVTTESFAAEHPEAVTEAYWAVAAGIERARAADGDNGDGMPASAIRAGIDEVRPAVELAARYAYDQGLISAAVHDIDALFAFRGKVS